MEIKHIMDTVALFLNLISITHHFEYSKHFLSELKPTVVQTEGKGAVGEGEGTVGKGKNCQTVRR
jgi:hypothetical protein